MLSHYLTTTSAMNEASAPSLGKASGAGPKSKRKRSAKRLRAAARRALRSQDMIDREEKALRQTSIRAERCYCKDQSSRLKAAMTGT